MDTTPNPEPKIFFQPESHSQDSDYIPPYDQDPVITQEKIDKEMFDKMTPDERMKQLSTAIVIIILAVIACILMIVELYYIISSAISDGLKYKLFVRDILLDGSYWYFMLDVFIIVLACIGFWDLYYRIPWTYKFLKQYSK